LEGGAYAKEDEFCRVAYRGQDQPAGIRSADLGLRLARNATTLDLISYAAPTPAPLAQDDMVLVKGGTLPDASELAGKSVKSFYIGRTEVTWLEWKQVRNWAADNGYDIGNIGKGTADNHPAQTINWYDCIKWCNAKSEMEGLVPVYTLSGTTYKIGESAPKVNTEANGYRLPSEEEWEWAARGGVGSRGYKYSGSDDLNAVGWYKENSKGAEVDLGSVVLKKFVDDFKNWTPEDKANLIGLGTFPVAQKGSNELDLFDMSGNVWEWCWDLLGSYRRIGGGCWFFTADWCTVSFRGNNAPDYRNPNNGFRLARNL
jgi:formylglycine-generating enzyme required for sulfatase activity